MIRKSFYLLAGLLFAGIFILSCKKDSNQAEIDHGIIQAYVLDNQLDGEFTGSGLYYVIIDSGHHVHPTVNSNVTVSYKCYSLEDVKYDEGDYYSSDLYKLILGWQEGLQLIGEGGSIKLVVPSGLAYGSSGYGNIKGNEVIAFDITLHFFTK